MASYNVNYDDERFTQLEQEKQSELNKYNQTYDALIDERQQFSNQQQDLVDQWQKTQEQIANDNLNYQTELYKQKKEQAEKDYQKEANASYIDYLKENDRYGVSREQMVANGLSNSGYSESSKVSMYNTYQNRVASARQSLNTAKLEFDNAIKEAQLTNNATLAENALTALQQKMQIALDGFNYKDTQTQNKLNWEYNINNNYYDRYKDVENQINYENEQAEAIRQYNEKMAYQKEQDRLAQQRWEQELAYQKQQDAITNAQNWAKVNAEKAYYEELTGKDDETTEKYPLNTAYYQGAYNSDALTNGQVDQNKVFSNGYQPNNVNGSKLSGYTKNGSQVYVDVIGKTLQGTTTTTKQKVWKDQKGNLWIWDGSQNKYISYSDSASSSKSSKSNFNQKDFINAWIDSSTGKNSVV